LVPRWSGRLLFGIVSHSSVAFIWHRIHL
jgi:hypothetical protein